VIEKREWQRSTHRKKGCGKKAIRDGASKRQATACFSAEERKKDSGGEGYEEQNLLAPTTRWKHERLVAATRNTQLEMWRGKRKEGGGARRQPNGAEGSRSPTVNKTKGSKKKKSTIRREEEGGGRKQGLKKEKRGSLYA